MLGGSVIFQRTNGLGSTKNGILKNWLIPIL